MAPPRGNIHVYYNNIQISSSLKKVQVAKDQENAQSEKKRLPLPKQRWEKTKLTIRYLYHENIS